MADLVLSFRGEQVNVVKNINTILVKLTQLEKKLAGVTAGGRTASASMSGFGRKASAAMLRVGRGILRLTSMIGVGGLAGAFVVATKKAVQFETAMAEVGTLIINDDKATEKYSKHVRELAKNSSFAATDLAKGLYQTISAGTVGTETAAGAMKLLDTAQRAAVAGVTGVFEATDVLTTSLNAYGYSTEKAEHLSDILFTTVRLGKTTFGELASQMGSVASIAATAEISFEELNAAVVALTKAGLGTDMATTQLRATIVSFLKPTADLKRALGDPAKVLKERGLLGAMEMVKEYAQGDAAALTKLIPNIRALNAVSILAGKGTESFRNALKEMGSAAGATETAYEKMSKTFAVQSKMVWNKISDTLMTIGNKLMPILLKELTKLGKWVDENQDAIKDVMVTTLKSFIAFGKFILTNGPTIVTVLATIWATSKIYVWITALGKAKAAMTLFGMSVKTGLGALGLLASAITFAIATAGGLQEWAKDAAGSKAWDNLVDRINTKLSFQFSVLARMQQKLVNVFDEMAFGTSEFVPEVEKPAGGRGGGKKLSKDELDKIIADQKAAMDMLHQLEIINMDKLGQLKAKFYDDMKEIQEANFKFEEDRTKALNLREQKYQTEKAKIIKDAKEASLALDEKIQAAQTKADEKHLKELIKAYKLDKERFDLQKKYLKDQAEGAEKALQSYKDMRAEWSAMAVEKWGGGKQRDEGESWDEYSKRLGEGGKSWLNSVSEGFTSMWDKVTTGFLERIGEKLFDILESGIDLLLTPLKKMYEPILVALSTGDKDATNAAIDDIIELFTKLAENLGPILRNLIEEGIPKVINAIIQALPKIIEAIFTYIPDLIIMIVKAIPKILVVIIQKLPLIIRAIIALIPEIIKAIIAMIPHIIGAIIKEIPMIAWEIASGIVKAVLSLIPGLKKGNKGGIFSGIGKGKGTSDNPLVTEEKQEVSVEAGNVEPMDPTHLAALKNKFEESKGGPQSGESFQNYTARMADMLRRLKEQGVEANLGPTDLFHKGGFIKRVKKAIKAHTGMFVMPSMSEDDRLILAQTGEGILNRQATANVGGEAGINAMNAGGGGGSTVNNFIWAPEHAFVEDSGKVIDEMQADMINKRAGKVQKLVNNRVAGFKTRK